MKTNLRDYLFTSLSIFLILLAAVTFTSFLDKAMPGSLREVALLINALSFVFTYGFISAIYLRMLNRFFPLQEGVYDMQHPQFTLYKLHSVIGHLAKPALRLFFPEFLRPLYYALLGAKVGKNVAIGGVIIDALLTRIEDNVIIGHDTVVTSHAMVFDRFFLNPVTIRKRATLGVRTVIMPGVEIGENSVVASGAVVLMNTRIPPNELWGGIPAKKIKDISRDSKEM
jgi:acetyltransferase-like isoleucine patch superfamily enzyme